MAEEALKQQKVEVVGQETAPAKPVGKLDYKDSLQKLNNVGGINFIKGILPDAEKMDPRNAASMKIFLSEKINETKRNRLAKDIEKWLELLEQDKNAVELAAVCGQNQEKYQKLFGDNINAALSVSKNLETSYRTLDAFYKNAGTDKALNLRIMNVNKNDLQDSNSEYFKAIDELLKNAYDRLSLKDAYSLMAIPGHIFEDKAILLMWAKMAHKYKTMLISDHNDDQDLDSMLENVSGYRDSDVDLQNVILCANWLLGREKQNVADEYEGLYIPPSGALAGMLYNDNTNISQGAGGKKYGTVSEIKGVRLDLLKSELASLASQQVVPMTFSDGRVMAFNNATLYNGDNMAMKEYPIVRVFEWVKKVLINFLNDEVLQNWDTKVSPKELKQKIADFMNANKGFGKLFEDYTWKADPVQDPATKNITLDIDIKPYFAAKNFIVKLSADKNQKDCKIE
jgi:hypothetical protein